MKGGDKNDRKECLTYTDMLSDPLGEIIKVIIMAHGIKAGGRTKGQTPLFQSR
jgi:hypothetical protein